MNQNQDQGAETNPYAHPQGVTRENTVVGYPAQTQETEGDATGGVIPYKNAPALIAYYLSILSLLPCIGLPFGVASLILGIIGLKKRAANPVIKGSVHAWIGIIVGGGTTAIWTTLIILFIVQMSLSR